MMIPTDDVDEHRQAGNGIAAHEFRSTVHRAEEAAFVFKLLAALLGGFLVDQTADRSASIAICLPGIESK